MREILQAEKDDVYGHSRAWRAMAHPKRFNLTARSRDANPGIVNCTDDEDTDFTTGSDVNSTGSGEESDKESEGVLISNQEVRLEPTPSSLTGRQFQLASFLLSNMIPFTAARKTAKRPKSCKHTAKSIPSNPQLTNLNLRKSFELPTPWMVLRAEPTRTHPLM